MNNETSMWPIFIAHGPAFKKNFKIDSFKNVDIYPLMCHILGVQPGTACFRPITHHKSNFSLNKLTFLAINNGSLERVLNMLTVVAEVKNKMNMCKFGCRIRKRFFCFNFCFLSFYFSSADTNRRAVLFCTFCSMYLHSISK
jgi:hypothetical protein